MELNFCEQIMQGPEKGLKQGRVKGLLEWERFVQNSSCGQLRFDQRHERRRSDQHALMWTIVHANEDAWSRLLADDLFNDAFASADRQHNSRRGTLSRN